MKKALTAFALSLKAQLFADGIPLKKFITEEVYLKGKKFSFAEHDFQEYIIDIIQANFGCTISVSKCSQIGLSELCNTAVLAVMATRPGTGVIVSFPNKTFAQEVFKTRFSTIIDNSPLLSGMLNRNVDSASAKQFNNESIAYALGANAASKGTLLNRPASIVFNDEIDKSDDKIRSGYRSRMTHTKPEERLVLNISTPTVDGVGIDAEIKDSRIVHTSLVGCPCGHEFVGDYYTHVVVPGFDKNLVYLTKTEAAKLDISKAYLECPECKQEINKDNKKTIWQVKENPEGTKKKIGIVLDPFVAMAFISVPDLVESSFTYTSTVEFLNQGLGKVADVKDSTISTANIHFEMNESPGLPIAGLDLGKLCHYMRGTLHYDTTIHVQDIQVIPLPDLEEFMKQEFLKYYFAAMVMDSQPYTDLVYRSVKKYPRLYSAIYTDPTTPRPDLFVLSMTDKHEQIVRQIAINKNMAMNNFANEIDYIYTFAPNINQSTMVKHFTDMRKVRDYDSMEVRYKWQKSLKGDDHFFHSAIYLSMAAKLAQAGIQQTFSIPIEVMKMNPEALAAKNH